MITIEEIRETHEFLQTEGYFSPEVAIVLGTGLGRLLDHVDVIKSISYEDIPHFPQATVEFHSGKLILGELENKKIVAMQGRFHAYEGYNLAQLTLPIRVFKLLGAKELLLSNAAGSINKHFQKGELMLLEDHIYLQGGSPLTGLNDPAFGQRFVDLSRPYSPEMNERLKAAALKLRTPLNEGVYACVHGPHLETRAEYRYLSMIGADAVGMSTVPEVIVANQVELPCAAISVLTDECDPDNLNPVDIEDIIATAGRAEPMLVELIRAYLAGDL
jgi:purine-nucleoside phosphorylase